MTKCATGSGGWSAAALGYYRAHGISPDVAAACGVTEHGGALSYPNVGDDGTPYQRVRSLNRNRTYQPRGVPLAPWWPAGRPTHQVAALVTEGEPDALSALTAIRGSRSRLLGNIAVVSVPGTGFAAAALGQHLDAVGMSNVWLAYDNDDAGRTAAEQAMDALAKRGIPARHLHLPVGSDLADCLAAASEPARWLHEALLKRDPACADLAAERENELLRKAGAMKRVGFDPSSIVAAVERENRARQPVLHPTHLDRLKRTVYKWTDSAPLWLTDPAAFTDDPVLNGDERSLLRFLIQRLRSDGTRHIGVRELARQMAWRGERVIAAKRGLLAKHRVGWTDNGRFKPGTFEVRSWAPADSSQGVPPVGTELPEHLKEQTNLSSPHRPSSSVPPPGTRKRAA